MMVSAEQIAPGRDAMDIWRDLSGVPLLALRIQAFFVVSHSTRTRFPPFTAGPVVEGNTTNPLLEG